MRERDKSKTSAWRRVRSACAELGHDRNGSALFYTTLSLPVLIGFAVLAIDGSRFMNLNTTLQNAADGLALAAAGELDRRPDACDRAVRALTNLVENDQMFGDVGDPRFDDVPATIEFDDVTPRFLETLPADDSGIIDETYEGNCDTPEDAALVRYIEVRVKPQSFTTLFPASFLGGSDTAATSAVAVAGFDAVVCEFTPLFICNPWDKPIAEVIEDGDNIGKQIRFHMVPPGCGEGCAVTPGNFGLLESPSGGSNPEIKDMLATKSPSACFIQNDVTTKPGINGIGDWLNVRFDLYEKDAKLSNPNKYPDEEYGPAENVRKGYTGNTCGNLVKQDINDDPFTRLRRDDTWLGDGNLGSGDWDFIDYWQDNFGTAPPNGWSNTPPNRPTRYQVYRYELENSETLVEVGPESSAPICRTPITTVDRRIIYAAVLDCSDGAIQGKTTAQAEGFVEMFLTEPAGSPPEDPNETIYVEIKNLIEPANDTSIARDRVQLYR